MIDVDNLDFHPRYVAPYYGGLMGFNYMRESGPIEFLRSVRALRNELSNDDIRTLLNHNWRPSKVGAWIIGLCQIEEMEKDLTEYLKARPIYSEHVIINLTLFNTPLANNALNEFVNRQLGNFLDVLKQGNTYEILNILDRNSVFWALSACRYLDSINSTNNYQEHLNSPIWSELKIELEKSPKGKTYSNIFTQSVSNDFGFEEGVGLVRESFF